MRSLKIIVILFVILTLFFPVTAEKRKPRKSIKELSDPNSPSYVPYPYPKNRNELIADIKYFYVDVSGGAYSFYIGGTPIDKIITSDLFSSSSTYKIGKIVKVKNRMSYLPDDYAWLIYVNDQEGDAVMRIMVRASGIVMGNWAIDKSEFPQLPERTRKAQKRMLKVLEEEDVKKILSEVLNDQLEDKDIKKIERVGYKSGIGDILTPSWKFTMKDGSVYYYSENRDMVYEIDERISWKKKDKLRPPIRNKVTHCDYLPDTISDELLTLKPASKRK